MPHRACKGTTGANGFTLIELLVVVLVIALLVAIAIPVFLGARTRAQDRAAQADLRTALITEREYITSRRELPTWDQTAAVVADLRGAEPSLDWMVPPGPPPEGRIIVLVGMPGEPTVSIGVRSRSGMCFTILDVTETLVYGLESGMPTTPPGQLYGQAACGVMPATWTRGGWDAG